LIKLSIITVNFNNDSGLSRTLKSVKNQNLADVEIIVIDGGSSDDSLPLIQEYKTIITKFVSEPDNGIYDAMNKGIAMAKGEYVLFLNSGDHFYNSTSVEDNLPFLNTSDIISFDIEMVHKERRFIKQHPDILKMSYLMEHTFAHQSTCIKRSLFEKVGKYDTSLKIVADWKFFIEAIVFHKASYKAVHTILSTNYLDGISSTGEGSLKRKYERIAIKESVFKLFESDYKDLELLTTNRFKLLRKIEESKIGQKVNSVWLRILLFLLKGKTLKDLE
jgi:glycosyltransferase involved in cell wall biosynthesis